MDEFVVRPRLTFWISLLAWILCWKSLSVYLGTPDLLPNASESFIINVFRIAIILFNALFGPIAVILSSWSVRITKNTLTINRILGLRSKTYRWCELKDYSELSNANSVKILLMFTDGKTFKVSRYASGYKRLSELLLLKKAL